MTEVHIYNITADDPGDGYPLCYGEVQNCIPDSIEDDCDVEDYDDSFQVASPRAWTEDEIEKATAFLTRLGYAGVAIEEEC